MDSEINALIGSIPKSHPALLPAFTFPFAMLASKVAPPVALESLILKNVAATVPAACERVA
jgi:hypothetical protein